MLTKKQRLKAIWKCFYFGIMPYWVYEKECHYKKYGEDMDINTYWEHLIINMYTAKSLILKTEHVDTHKFHKSNPRYIRKFIKVKK